MSERSFWRRSSRSLLIALAALVTLLVAAVVAVVVFASSTNPPDPDEFYAAPSPLPSGPPGTVIRTEELEQPPEGSNGWKLLYLSKSYTGEPTVVSGLLFVPDAPAPAGGAGSWYSLTARLEWPRTAQARTWAPGTARRSTV